MTSMKTTGEEAIHIRHLRWAMWFSSVDVERLGRGMLTAEGGVEEVKHQLYEFVRDSNLQGDDTVHKVENLPGPPGKFLDLLTSDRMEHIRGGFEKALSAFADDKTFVLRLSDPLSDQGGTLKNPSLTWFSINPLNPFFQSIQVESDPVSKSILALGLHVAFSRLSGERIRRCARPGCGTIFIRERKPQKGKEQYCGPTCAQAAATENYLKRRQEAAAREAKGQPPQKLASKERRKTAPRKTKKG